MREPDFTNSYNRLIDIGIALSAEKDIGRLVERILIEAKDIANADGATLYVRTQDDTLRFESMHLDSLGIAQGGTTGVEISLPSIEMYIVDGQPNYKQLASYAACTGETINIDDVYANEEFDLSGTMKFDEATGYRTTSLLTIPLKNNQGEVVGIIQLVNARDFNTGDIVPFSERELPLIQALASQAAVALERNQLLDTQRELLDSFIQLIASALDAKSPYTGGHCQRVPELVRMLTEAACKQDKGSLAEFDLDEDDWYELHITSWLHDCGKVTIPEYVVDKATKLETIGNRIHEIRTRFEVLKCDAVIEYQQALLDGEGEPIALKRDLDEKLARFDDDFSFIAESNMGGEFMSSEKIDAIKEIAKTQWLRTLDDRLGISQQEKQRRARTPARELPAKEFLLEDRQDHLVEQDLVIHAAEPDNPYGFKITVPDYKYNRGEVYNLCVQRGTLTVEERFKINDHIMQTIIMLEKLRFPKHLANIPEYAGGHHERMDGAGYPRSLDGGSMSIPARIMAIADIFEALTAADRPYKAAKTLSESIEIMSFMASDKHIDADLFELFLTSGVYREYAQAYLQPFQIDQVDIEQYLAE